MNLLLNKELQKSIKSNKLIIDITTEEYNKINLLINKLKRKYKKETEFINNNKEKFDKIKSHNLLVKDIIYEVIENFEIIKKYNVCIFLTGSFARYTNKLNSDLDLHFSYKNKYKNILFKYEEIIYYILLSIFDLNRGKVHNMILSRINKSNIKKINKILDKDDLEIILVSPTNEIKYNIKGNIKNRIYLQYGNKKDIKTIYKYLKKEIFYLNREWAHVFYIFTNQKDFFKYYDKLLKIEKKNIQFYPDFINKDIKTFHETIGKNEIIISRIRDTGIKITYNNKAYNIDIDFLWEIYLSLFSEKEKIVLCSNHQLYQLYMVLMLEKCFNQDVSTIGLATPYINVTGNDLEKSLEERVLSLKLFTLFNLKWTKKENLVDLGLITYLNSMNVNKKQQLYDIVMQENISESLENDIKRILLKDFNFQNANKNLKRSRRNV